MDSGIMGESGIMIFGRNFGRNFQRLNPRRKRYPFISLDDKFFVMWSPWGKFATWRYLSDIFHHKIAYHHSSSVTLAAYDRMIPLHQESYDRAIPIPLEAL